jgi:protein-disulfide isomerase
MSKQFWGVIIAIVVIFVGVVALTGNKSDKSNGSKSDKAATTNHVEGKGTTGVTLVEYGDYQCPYCGLYYPTVKQVVSEYGDQIKFQFVNFPLTSLHKNAFAAARAAEAAGLQGKYWEMHDQLYPNQNEWSEAGDPITYFNKYAQNIGLNVAQFDKDYASSRVNDLINADMAKGNALKITATPTFFIDGQKVEIGNDVSAFKKEIDAAIQKQQDSNKTSATQQ